MGGVRAARARARREAVVGVVGYGYDGGDGVRAARARREGVVTVEVQAWCAASVVWRVMREQKGRREDERKGSVLTQWGAALVIQTTKRKRRGEEEKRKKKRGERRTERRGRREEAKRKKSAARGRGRATAATGGAVRAARARREGVVTVEVAQGASHRHAVSPKDTRTVHAAAGGGRHAREKGFGVRVRWGEGFVGVRVRRW